MPSMDYRDRLYRLKHRRVANPIEQSAKDQKLRHEIAMDELAAQRGLHGLSDEDKCIIEAATIEILTMDSVFNTVPSNKRNGMMKKAVKSAMGKIAADLIHVTRTVVAATEQSCTKGTYSAHRFGSRMVFSYHNENYVAIDMAGRTFTVTQIPNYATARKMIRFLAELCGLKLPDMQEKTYTFEVIHDLPDN